MRRALFSAALFLLLTLTPACLLARNHPQDIAIIDRALKSAKPADPWVKFGDVGIKYSDLKTYRDNLAASDRKASGSQIEAVTPPGTAFKWPSGNVNYRFDPIGLTNGTVYKMTTAGAITTLHSFIGSDGTNPIGSLVRGTDGNFYGTTQLGGTSNNGTVFKIAPASPFTLTTLYNFSGNDGSSPAAGLVQGTDGNFYGTTQIGGTNNTGTIFKITAAGVLTTLYSFSANGSDGMNPVASLIQAAAPDGNFYGVTQYGGTNNAGTVFKISSAGAFTSIHSFNVTDGYQPVARLLQAVSPDLNFYGVTQFGGTNNAGTVFKVTSTGTLTSIHSFDVSDGYQPVAGLIQAASPDLNFYGTTQLGGASSQGTVFQVTSSGTVTTLHSFVLNDGQQPTSSVVQAASPDLNFYGTVFRGGTNADGTTFKITATGTFTSLHTFIGSDGTEPAAGLIQSTDGNFYGTTPGTNALTALKQQQFRDGVGEWAAFANLHFLEFSSGAPPANFITVQEKPANQGEGGFSSSVGMAGGEQFVQCGAHSWNRGTVCHEVGHAIGLWHEQQRPDRDTYVTINFSNIDPGLQPNFTIISGGQTFGTSYDFYSVMHYKRNDLTNKPGTPNPNAPDPTIDTIDPKPAYVQYLNLMGNVLDRILSKSERAGMAAIYGNPSPLPGATVTNTSDSGTGSLRTAIYYAFDKSTDPSPVPTTISFNIPTSDPGYNSGTGMFTIKPTYTLPALGNGTTINGNGQIVLDGSIFALLQGPFSIYSPGITLRAANCTIQGLTIQNFNQSGILVFQGTDPNGSSATGNVIGGLTSAARNVISGNADYGIGIHDTTTTSNIVEGNYIGTNQAGSAAQANGLAGVVIYLGAHGNTIGGTTPGAGNVISGNTFQGVFIGDAGSNNNLIAGNYIGTNAAGTGAVPNLVGVEITNGAQASTIGGTTSSARNVVSGNSADGIQVHESGSQNNVIEGNFIGLDKNGSTAVPNQSAGIEIYGGASSTIIGGTSGGAGNVISGNMLQGVIINASNGTQIQGNVVGLDAGGTNARPNSSSGVYIFAGAQNTIMGGTAVVARNVIAGNTGDGIDLDGVSNTLIHGNYIGVDFNGSSARPNAGTGVSLFSNAASNTIGGVASGARNLISGNKSQGITLDGSGTTGNVVQGNLIGTDVTGSSTIGNGFVDVANHIFRAGVDIFNGANGNIIGGTVANAGNVISGNAGGGLGLSGTATTGNTVQGNFIGTNLAGSSALGNGFADPPNNYRYAGISIFGAAQSNTIGGMTVAARNIISGNAAQGVFIGDPGTSFNIIEGNFIGTNVGGTSALANGFSGIGIFSSAASNTIGGTMAGTRNVISGNTNEGILVGGIATGQSVGPAQNLIEGNYIGLNAVGSGLLANGGTGVYFFGDSRLNIVGGTALGASNTISGNGSGGIAVDSFNTSTIKETISRNLIFNNTGAGIALYNGGNNSQPAPNLTSATLSTMANFAGTDVTGSLTAAANTQFTIEFFASPAGGDEGQFFVGSTTATTNGSGTVNFTASLAAAIPALNVVTATATDPNGNTSAFSSTRTVATTDSDGDGMPNNWENHYSLNPNVADPNLDSDGDGRTNLQEFLAGTNPLVSSSRLAISNVDRLNGNPRISFTSVSGKTYRLESKDPALNQFGLTLFNSGWSTLIDGIYGTGGLLQITDPSAFGVNRRFYRLVLEP